MLFLLTTQRTNFNVLINANDDRECVPGFFDVPGVGMMQYFKAQIVNYQKEE